MQNIDYITLNAFFEENIDFFIGARLQKIQQPTRKDFIFQLRNNGESRKFYININPQFYHVTFMSKENEERRGLSIPKQPPMFCMLLRKYLEGCKVSDACVIEGERILELHFETMDEFSQKRSLCLCIELMGKHSNVILYDRETKNIIGCAHNVGPEKSRYRELQGGLTYIYPPEVNINKFSGQPLYKTLEGDLPLHLPLDLPLHLPLDLPLHLPLSEKLDNYFASIQEGINVNNGKTQLRDFIYPKLKRVKNSIDKITQLLNKRDKTEEYKLYGELLTANLYQKKDYSSQIEVLNYFTGVNVTIELDPTKTLNENAQRYFKLYTKSKTTKEKSEQMLSELAMECEYLENVLYSVEKADSLKELEEIKSELGLLKLTPHPSPLHKERERELLKFDINGFEVYVGKNNKQNDYIISKLSKDEDYWFHTRL